MARTRKPTALLNRSGAFDKDPQRARPNEPQPSGPLGAPPESLSPAEAAIWIELADMVPAGVLTNADRLLLEITCRLMHAERQGGRVIRKGADERGNVIIELVPMKAAERSQLLQCLSRMGLTPADRSRIAVPREPKQPEDPFAALAATPRVPTSDDEVQ